MYYNHPCDWKVGATLIIVPNKSDNISKIAAAEFQRWGREEVILMHIGSITKTKSTGGHIRSFSMHPLNSLCYYALQFIL
jgi:hypothetical protein